MKSDDPINGSEDKSSAPRYEKEGEVHTSDTELGHGYVETVETTHRGLKARHAQMIALGGTIGR